MDLSVRTVKRSGVSGQRPVETEPPSKHSKDVRKITGTVLAIIGWGASGSSTILALSLGASSISACVWPFLPPSPFCIEFVRGQAWITRELLVGTMALGWVLAGSGGVFLRRKVALVLPIINLVVVLITVFPPITID